MGKSFAGLRRTVSAVATITVIGAVALAQQSLVPRSPAGIPDLNGVWQAERGQL